jgi:probable rRNA maturation factor
MIQINNLISVKINEAKFKAIVKSILRKERRDPKSEISIAIVNAQKIRSLNKKYRKKNKATDVLSFVYSQTKNNLSGEIIICPQIVKKNAKYLGGNFQKELERTLIHGILHILGYDHEKSGGEEKIMRKKEEAYLKIKI